MRDRSSCWLGYFAFYSTTTHIAIDSELLKKAEEQFPALNAALGALSKLIPEGQYCKAQLASSIEIRTFWLTRYQWLTPSITGRYNDSFTRVMQQVAFLSIYRNWLSVNLCSGGTFDDASTCQVPTTSLLQKEDVIKILDCQYWTTWIWTGTHHHLHNLIHLWISFLVQEPLILTTEEYLHAIITMINELTRLSINIVTLGLYQVPIGICQFCKDLAVGFSMLNLKNDSLRKRFDSIKVSQLFSESAAIRLW